MMKQLKIILRITNWISNNLSFNLEYVAVDSEDKIKSLLPHVNKKEYFNKLVKDMGLTLKETGIH